MDTIRMKIHLLKVETSDTINRLLSMETAATRNTQLVKDRELKLRQLMKGVSQKENELDKATSALEKTEKRIKEADHGIQVAKEEAAHLKDSIRLKEEQMKRNEMNYGPKASWLAKEAAKADEAEKVRKDLEHKVDFYDDKLEKMQQELMAAKKTMRETHEKYDETSRRLAHKEKKLQIALEGAEKAEKRVEQLEASLSDIARKMANKESSREKVGKKEENYKNQLRQITMREREAEHRALLKEDEMHKLELFVSQLKEEQDILQKMTEQKITKFKS